MSKKPKKFIASVETDVPVSRSIEQIRQLVERFGAAEFGLQYDPGSGEVVAVSFKVRDPHLTDETGQPLIIPVALRAPFEVLYKMLLDQAPGFVLTDRRKRLRDRAARVAWRNLHDFIRSSLIGVNTGLMSLGEAFMANVVVSLPTGEAKRLGELVAEGALLRPGEGGRLLLGKDHS